MLTSYVRELTPVSFPKYTGEHLYMLPTTLGDLVAEAPPQYADLLDSIVTALPYDATEKVYLTIDEKLLMPGKRHRRGGVHIDGNFIFGFGGGGWLNGVPGKVLSPEQHKIQYQSPMGGVILASNYSSCQGWVGEYDTLPGRGGSMDHATDFLESAETLMLKENTAYLGNSTFVHKGLLVRDIVKRQLVRITLSEHVSVTGRVGIGEVCENG